jgi:formate/nitrite transporter FocA (FNT family)
MPQRTTKGRRREPAVIEGFFIGGATLVVISLMYALAKSWPSFDPLVLSALVGGGLLLVVVCERLSLILRELRRITALMQRPTSDTEPAGQEHSSGEDI